ncbi:MAG TPA: hypothetical protein VGO50_13930 [Pyrinomonadaceae bacterium]|jgi:hypothetical protein|nr:hypothetical protein [Pyrinomonadaceae bacterium]
MNSFFEELNTLVAALEENNIEYAVCGGLALTIHGFPRATFDIDVLIREESLKKAFELAERQGFDIHGLDISFKERAVEIRRVSKIDEDGEVLPLDFLLVTPFVEDVWEGKENLLWEGKMLSIVSREGLIKMKQLAGRPKDLIDIERIQNEKD